LTKFLTCIYKTALKYHREKLYTETLEQEVKGRKKKRSPFKISLKNNKLGLHSAIKHTFFMGTVDRIIKVGKTSKIIQSNHQPMPVTTLTHVPQCNIHSFLEDLQGQ